MSTALARSATSFAASDREGPGGAYLESLPCGDSYIMTIDIVEVSIENGGNIWLIYG